MSWVEDDWVIVIVKIVVMLSLRRGLLGRGRLLTLWLGAIRRETGEGGHVDGKVC